MNKTAQEPGTVVVPAPPGFFFLEALSNSDDPDNPTVFRYPVVAWRIFDDIAVPIFAGDVLGEAQLAEVTALLLPDGRVADQHGTVWLTEEAWEAAIFPELIAEERSHP